MNTTAIFTNGREFNIANSKAGYTHAWMITVADKDGSTDWYKGFAKNREAAEKAMASEIARSAKNGYAKTFAEIVPVV